MDIKYQLAKPYVDKNDIEEITKVLQTPTLSIGPKLLEFEGKIADYVDIPYSAVVNSGTSALMLALLAKGVTHDDEVITSSFSFISSANVAIHVGGVPKFADIDPTSLNITPDTVRERITDKTKAIIPVDIFGRAVDQEGFRDLADEHNLVLIEDSCEALGTLVNGKHVGSKADAAAFAFYPNKQITTGEGGVVVSNDKSVIDKVKQLRNQGRDLNSKWLIHSEIGYNFRMSEINAALGCTQMDKIEIFIEKKSRIKAMYDKAFSNCNLITTLDSPPHERTSWFVNVIQVNFEESKIDNRYELSKLLLERGSQSGMYFEPIHLQPIYKRMFGYKEGDFPITEKIAKSTIAIPFHLDLQEEDIEEIANEIMLVIEP